MSIEIELSAAIITYFIGETANNKLNVTIVGITTATNAAVLSIAPIPTVKPPKQPTTIKITAIQPKRLNSKSFVKFVVSIILSF